jgi:hypothetical protein
VAAVGTVVEHRAMHPTEIRPLRAADTVGIPAAFAAVGDDRCLGLTYGGDQDAP